MGNVAEYIAMADRALEQSVGSIIRASQLYESEPWGFEAPTHFWNQALEVETELSPMELLAAVNVIEAKLGRDRDAENITKVETGEMYTSRTMDIDIILYGDEIMESEVLTIPHTMMREREFVLEPIVEIAPERIDPVTGCTLAQLYEKLKA